MSNLNFLSMKLSIFALVLVMFYIPVFSQSVENELKSDELPTVVIKKAGEDFSVYLPDRNPDLRVRDMQKKFIGYNLGKTEEGYDEYLVLFEGEDASLAATYNEKGKLIRVVERYERVQLPRAVIFSVYKEFPGWTIVHDKFFYTQSNGDVVKKQYNLKLKKEKDIKRIIVDPNGSILAGI